MNRRFFARLILPSAILLSMLGIPGTASAAPAVVLNCNGHTVISASHVKNSTGHNYGAIQLCRDGTAHFAIYINYNAAGTEQGKMPAENWANAWIYRYENGVYKGRLSCDNTEYGGNEHVFPGQTMCVSGRYLYWGPSHTYRAAGFRYRLEGDDSSTLLGSGWTARCTAEIARTCYPE